MKNLIILFILLLSAKNFGQTKGISYQAVILNAKGEQLPGVNNVNAPLANSDICMLFKLFDEYSKLEYQEVVQIKTDQFGMVNLIIGGGVQTGGYALSFDTVVWDSLKKTLVVSINTDGSCSTFSEISNQPLNYVPFAYSATNATNVTGVVAITNGGTNATSLLGAKINFGIDKVDNTSDLDKPLSIAAVNELSFKENLSNKSTSIKTDGASDVKYPSVKSVKDYVDASAGSSSTALASEITRATTAEGTLTTNLASEITRATTAEASKEALANKSTSVSADGTSDTKYPSVKSVKDYVDASATSSSTALATETTRATTAEGTLTTNLTSEITRATTAEASKEALANKSTSVSADGTSDTKYPSVKSVKDYVDASATSSSTALATETTRATTAEGTLTTNLASEITRATTAEASKEALANKSTSVSSDGTSDTKYPSVKSVKDYVDASATSSSTALATETTRATTAEGTLTTNLASEVSRATTAEASKEALVNKSTSVSADGTSDTKYPSVKSVKDYVDASATSSSTALATETTRATTAEGTLTTNLASEITRATTAEASKEALANKSTSVSADGTSDTKYPSVKSVKDYVDASATSSSTALATETTRATTAEASKEALVNKSTSVSADGTSDTKYPSVKSVKDYVDASATSSSTALVSEITRATAAEGTLTTNLASEITRATTAEASKEALANKSTSVSADGTSDTKYPSVKSVKDYVDASATSSSTALATETTRATTAEGTLTTNLASEITRATTAEASKEALANKSTSVSSDGTSDTKYPSVKSVKDYVDASATSSSTALATETTRATTAEGTLTTNLASEITRATTAEASKEALANKSTSVSSDGTSDTKYPSVKSVKNYVDASATLGSTALASEITRATTAEGTLTTNLATETTRATTAEGTLTTNLASEITRATTAEASKEALVNKSTSVSSDGTSDTKYPSVKSVKDYVDASATSGSTALATEVSRSTTAEATLTTNLASEITRATTAEASKEALVNKSTSVSADGTSDTKYPSVKSVKDYVDASATSGSTALASEITRATAAEGTLTTNLTSEVSRATTAEASKEALVNKSTSVSSDGTSDTKYPSVKSVKDYVDASATSGSTALATEVSRATTAEASKEALVNKSTSVSADGTSDTKYPSVKSVKDYVDASATSGSTALATEVSRATTAEATLTTNLATETTRAITAEGTLTTNLASEITRATTAEASKEVLANKSTSVSADGTSDTKYPSVKSVKDYVDASATLGSTALASEITRATAAEGTLTTNLTTETTRATAAEGTLTTNLASEITRATTAEASKEALANKSTSVSSDGTSDTKYPSVKSVKDYVDASATSSSTALATETTRATTAEGTLTTNLASEITRATTAEASKEDASNKSTDGTFTSNSDVKFPTEKATKTYADAIAISNTVALTNELNRATAAESALAANLAIEASNRINADATKAPLNSPAFTGTVTGVTSTMVGLGNVDNTSDLNKPVSNATQTALDLKASIASLDLKAPLNSPAFTGTVTGVTSTMVGLGNVDNTSDLNKPVSNATQTALDLKASIASLDLKAPLNSPAFTGTVTGVTSTMVGLGNVDNTSDLNKPVSNATQTALDLKASIASLDLKAPLNSPAFTGTVTGVTSTMVGLGNVDNTSDLNKPVSNATQTALDLKASIASLDLKAPLNSPAFTGTVTGVTSAMVGLVNVDNTSDLNKPVSIDTQTALDLKASINSPAFTGTVTGVTSAMVGLGNVNNTSDANKPVSNATQTALDLKAPLNSPAFTGTITGVTSAMVGLGNVDNTSDLNKPVSIDTQTALDLKASIASLDLKAPLNSPAFTGTITGVTSAMVGLGNVDNTSDLNKPVSIDTQTALDLKASIASLDLKAPLNSPAFTGTVTGVTSTMVGLGNVNNTSDLNKPVSTDTQTALDLKASIASLDLKAPLNSPAFTGTVTGVTSAMVGLGNVDNTSDLNKPVSIDTQTALDLKASINSPAFTGTVTGVTSAMVGLGNVNNTSDLNKPVSIDTQTALDLKASINSPAFTGTVTGVTSAMVGLGNVDNTSDLNKPVSIDTQTALDLKASIASLDLKAPLNSPAFTGTVTGVTSAMVGLGNVDNTSDLNKPVSNATQTALDLKASIASLDLKAPLNSPAFTGTVTGLTSAMVGLGNVDNTTDLNKPVSIDTQTALDLKASINSPAFTGTVTGVTSAMVGLGNVNNTSDLNKPVSIDTQTALDLKASIASLDLKAPLNSPAFTGTVTGVTSTMVGLGNVNNTSDLNKPVSIDTQTALDLKASIASLDLKAPLNSPAFTGTVTGLTSAMVGLGNVNNTSDLNKPVSIDTQTALDLKASINSPAFTGTVTGVTSTMVGLGNVNNTSDANKPVSNATQTALDLKAPLNSPAFTGTVTGVSSAMVGLGNVDNTSDLNKPVSNATQAALDLIASTTNLALKAPLNSPAFTGVPIAPTAIIGTNTTQIATTAYVTATLALAVREVADEFNATATQTSFTLSQIPSLNSKVKMYVNGVRISNTAYSVVGSTLVYVPANNGSYALSINDRIQFDYFY
ncbi:beta strand repeat-containing protein [Flavobacterium sp. GNP002]